MLNYIPKGSMNPLYSLSDLCYAILSCPVVPFLSGGGLAPWEVTKDLASFENELGKEF